MAQFYGNSTFILFFIASLNCMIIIIIEIYHRYIQFLLITVGVYASRMWTMAIAATLLYSSSRSLDFIHKVQKWFYPIGWGYDNNCFLINRIKLIITLAYICRVPLLIAIVMCSTLSPKESELQFRNPNFQLGRSQAATSTFILIFCFIGRISTRNPSNYTKYSSFYSAFLFSVTMGCLVLQQRYRRRSISTSYTNVPGDENLNNDNGERRVVDVEDLVSPSSRTPM